MPFAQLILGPPGSGKSTYCDGMHQFLSAIGRKSSVVNLDPANDRTSYPCALDIRELVTLDEVMSDESLGPNGGVLYAIEELEHNLQWLEDGLKKLGEDYVLFDCPGQVELFTHHSSLRNIFFRIQKLGYRLVAVHLTDSYCLTLPSLYISTLLLSLRTMLQMDLPHLNVLTKIDKLAGYEPLPFKLDFYTEVQDLSELLPSLARESPVVGNKFEGLNKAIIELVEDFGLVSFETLAIEDKRSVMTLLHAIDRAGGYAFGGAEGANDTVWQVAMREGFRGMDIEEVQEKYLDREQSLSDPENRQSKNEQNIQDTIDIMERGEDDLDDEELEAMRAFVPDPGIKVVRKSGQ